MNSALMRHIKDLLLTVLEDRVRSRTLKRKRIQLLADLLGNRSYAKIKDIGERQKKKEFKCQNY